MSKASKKVVFFLFQEKNGRRFFYHEGDEMQPEASGRFERSTLASIERRKEFLDRRMITTKIGRGYAAGKN